MAQAFQRHSQARPRARAHFCEYVRLLLRLRLQHGMVHTALPRATCATRTSRSCCLFVSTPRHAWIATEATVRSWRAGGCMHAMSSPSGGWIGLGNVGGGGRRRIVLRDLPYQLKMSVNCGGTQSGRTVFARFPAARRSEGAGGVRGQRCCAILYEIRLNTKDVKFDPFNICVDDLPDCRYA